MPEKKGIEIHISQEHAEELIEISKRLKVVRDRTLPMLRDPDTTEEAMREVFISLGELNKELNDLYIRSAVPEMMKLDVEGLKECSAWHLPMLEGLVISMIPMCPAGFREVAAKGSEQGPANVEPGPNADPSKSN
jgi:hypothetical protein